MRVSALVPVAIALVAGCGDVIAQAIGAGATGPGDGGVDAADDVVPNADAPLSDAPGSDGGFCSGHGPIALPGQPGLCAGDLANIFRFAACACSSLDVSGKLTTSSFDSTADGGASSVASIASNGEVSTNSLTTLAGSVWAAGPRHCC